MAWTGAVTVTSVGPGIVRITGVSLAALASGTIGLDGGGGDVSLPATFPGTAPAGLTMADVVEVPNPVPVAAVTAALTVHIVKTNGPFLITVTNDSALVDTPSLEIYVIYGYKMSGWNNG